MKRKDTPVNESLEPSSERRSSRCAALNNIVYYQPKERPQKFLNGLRIFNV